MKISLMGARRSLVGRLIMKQVLRRDLCPPFFLAGGGRGRALFDEKNELLGEDLILAGLGEWYMNRDDSIRVIYQREVWTTIPGRQISWVPIVL